MSYITEIQPIRSATTSTNTSRVLPRRRTAAGVPVTTGLPGRLSGGLEVMLLLSTLSGLSLVLCTIAAGAF